MGPKVGNTVCVGVLQALINPPVLNKLHAELDNSWPEVDQSMALQQFEALPYLTAFIKESLRVSYGIVSPLPRFVNLDMSVGGYAVPAGVRIFHYSLAHASC